MTHRRPLQNDVEPPDAPEIDAVLAQLEELPFDRQFAVLEFCLAALRDSPEGRTHARLASLKTSEPKDPKS